MLRVLQRLSIMAMVLFMGINLTGCGDDDTPGTEPVNPVTPTPDKAMTSDQQKEYLEQVASEFMNSVPSSDFNKISDLYMYIRHNYDDSYDWDAVGNWAENVWDAARTPLGTTTRETDRWGYTYVYSNYSSLLLASNFTGHFIAEAGRWRYIEANDLQFIFNDQNGTQCVLKLTTSGSVKRVHAFNVDEWVSYSGHTEYYDRMNCIIGVPENIEVTLTQGSSQVVKVTVKIALSSLVGEEFDVSKSNFNVSMTTEFNNGYKIALSQVAYEANKQANASFTLSKSGKTLVAAAVSSNLSGIPSCNVSAFSSNFDLDDYNTDAADAKSPYVKLDILGKVQIQGRMQEVRKFVDYMDLADENETDEAVFKSYIDKANALADVNVFYDGKSTKQATIRLEPFVEDQWSGRTYWGAEPVMVFYDGSSYSTFEAFFNDTNFKNTINSFKRLANNYASLIDERIDW